MSWDLAPRAKYGLDGNYYLVAEWNKPHPMFSSQEVVEAARKAMGVDKDPTLESSLQWYRFPLSWLAKEERERDKRERE